MIITHHYEVVFDDEKDVQNQKQQAPLCPDCGILMSGYNSRRRSVIGSDGKSYEFLLRRLQCPSCKTLHIELPDIIAEKALFS